MRGEAFAPPDPAPVAEAGPAAGGAAAAPTTEPDPAAPGGDTAARAGTAPPEACPPDPRHGTGASTSNGSGAPSSAQPLPRDPAAPGPELVLDLGGEAIVLLRRERLGWRELARAPIDAEGEVRGTPALLRAAQAAARARAPTVTLWLPPDQVLTRRAVLPDAPEARSDAAFAEAAAAAGQSPADLAVAIAPPGPDGSSTILAAYRQSCSEARAYATGWGFTPLRVSTAVEAGAFGADGPELLDREEIEARLAAAAGTAAAGRDPGGAQESRPTPPTAGPGNPVKARSRSEALRPAARTDAARAPAPGPEPAPPRPSSTLASAHGPAPTASQSAGRRVPAAALVAAALLIAAGGYFALMPEAGREDAGAARTAQVSAPDGEPNPGAIAPSPAGETGAPGMRPAAPAAEAPDAVPGSPAATSSDGAPGDPLPRTDGLAAAPATIAPEVPAPDATAPQITTQGAPAPQVAAQGTAGADGAEGAPLPGVAVLSEPRATPPPPPLRTPLADEAPGAPATLGPVPRDPGTGIRLAVPSPPPAAPDTVRLQAGEPRATAAASTWQGKTPGNATTAIPMRGNPRSAIGAPAGRAGKTVAAPVTPVPSTGDAAPAGTVPAGSQDEPGTTLAEASAAGDAAADAPGPLAPTQSPAPQTRGATAEAAPAAEGPTEAAGDLQSPPQDAGPGEGEAAPESAETAEASPIAPDLAPPPAMREAAAADAAPAPGSADPEPAALAAQAADAETPGADAPGADVSPLALLHAPAPGKRPEGLGAPIRPSPRGAGADAPGRAALPGLGRSAPRQVERAAVEQGIPLDRTALIGILNFETGRQALLRLPNGRYERLVVGDSVEGWRVSVIGTDTMRLSRNGEERTLRLVNR